MDTPYRDVESFKRLHSGELYAYVVAHGRGLTSKLYPNIVTEINERKFATETKISYAPIPEYYTLPINVPYIDKGPGPYHPYARYSKHSHPKWATQDQTPELLLEPFGDSYARSWSTMADMIDMHSKKSPFIIIHDEDVVTVYQKLQYFIDQSRKIYLPREAYEYAQYLNKIVDLLVELKSVYLSVCKKHHREYDADSCIRFIEKVAVTVRT